MAERPLSSSLYLSGTHKRTGASLARGGEADRQKRVGVQEAIATLGPGTDRIDGTRCP